MNLSSAAVTKWDRVPIKRVRRVSDATGIPDFVIRPDVFRRPAHLTGGGNDEQQRERESWVV
jgi:hypothetical protein